MRSSLTRATKLLTRNGTRVSAPGRQLHSVRWSSSESGHTWSTPLAKRLAEAITTTGPIPVASYMRQCLTSDLGGYYTSTTSADRDQFGVKGDFVTSPEISQIFGELLGVWFVAEWMAQGQRSNGLYIMEVGPGRGTLMDDILRTIRNFPEMMKALEAVYMVEASQSLRQAQHQLLCGDHPLQTHDLGFQSTSRHFSDLKIIWSEDVRLIPQQAGKTPFIVAHEFFDALPIHVFQTATVQSQDDDTIQTPTGPIKSKRRLPQQGQWREMLVTPKPPHRLRGDEPEFELTLSKAATPHSMYLPETSPRYTALRNTAGATIEISPESQAYIRDFAIRMGGSSESQRSPKAKGSNAETQGLSTTGDDNLQAVEPSGATLIIDYGQPSTIPTNSLRGIRAHTRVSPFASAGAVDVSADVDFLALAETAINSSPGVEVHGPVDQARFLTAMGIEERAAQLVKRAVDSARGGSPGQDKSELTEVAKRIESGWRRLVDRSPQGMGQLYQVMAILPYRPTKAGEQNRRPVGFGGDITL